MPRNAPPRNGEQMQHRGRQWLGSGLIVLASLFWGVITTMSRLSYDGGGTAHTVVLIRFAAFVVVIGLVWRLAGRSFRLARADLLASLWMALTVLGMSVGYLSSVAYIPVSLAAMIFYAYPPFVGVLASLVGREPMTWLKGMALATAFLGLALALGPSFAALDPRGVALASLAAISVGVFTVFGGPVLRRVDTVTMNFYVNMWALLGFGAFAVVVGDVRLPTTVLGYVGLSGATLCYLAASIAIFAALPMIQPVRVALLSNIEPLVTLGAAALVLGETLTPAQLAGAALVLGAILAMTLGGLRDRL